MDETLDEQTDESSSGFLTAHRMALAALIAGCGVFFLLADLVTSWWFEDPFPAMIILNVITAQLTIICVWGTLVRGTFWVRLPWTLLLLVISWGVIVLGINIQSGKATAENTFTVGFLWMFGFVASFVPLKIAALCFRWHIIQPQSRHSKDSRRYAIRDVMIGTSLLAVTMAVGRTFLPDEDTSILQAIKASEILDSEPMVAISIFGVISLLVKLPCIWISLAVESSKVLQYIVLWAMYCFVLTLVELGFLIAVLGPIGDGELSIGIILGHQLMGMIMFAVCLALRGLGYRLERSLSTSDDQGNEETPESLKNVDLDWVVNDTEDRKASPSGTD